jgi:hypothetical protein
MTSAGFARSFFWATVGSAAAIATLGCNAIFGIRDGIPAGSGGGGAGSSTGSSAGGGTGGASVCPPVKPVECDPALLADVANCCFQGRSCQGGECVDGVCLATVLAQGGMDEEGIGMVVSGDQVMWSTGYAQSIYRSSIDGDGLVVLVGPNQTDFGYVTMLAADPDPTLGFVYFTDYDGARLGRASIQDGAPQVIAQVPAAVAPDAKAGYGRILLHGDHVYWAVDFQTTAAGSSHIWRAPRDPGGAGPVDAELVVMNDGAFGLVGDAEYLYFGDNAKHTVERLAWSEIGKTDAGGAPILGQPEVMASSQDSIGDVAVDDQFLYWAIYNQVMAQDKNVPGDLLAPLAEVESYVWGVVPDGRDVYFTSVGDSDKVRGALYRVPRAGGATPEKMYQPAAPAGTEMAKGISALAEDCDTVYFLVHETGLARKTTK